jgi:hypothetical protein
VAAGHLSPEAVLMMNALLAMKLARGAEEVYGSAAAGGKEVAKDETVDLPGGGKRVRIRTMEGLKSFLRSQQ